MITKDPSSFIEVSRTTLRDVEFRRDLDAYISESVGTDLEKFQNFAKYVPMQDFRRFLSRCEVFKQILTVHGSILECGVLYGGGLMTWALLSELYEPFNHLRHIIGFDTFSGKDSKGISGQRRPDGAAVDTFEDVQRAIALHDRNRALGHLSKVRLVKGDMAETAGEFLKANPHTVVSLLSLDFDTYEPTVEAIKTFVPRMPRGAVIVFDELNHEIWPGETVAVTETLGLSKLRLQRFPWGGTLSYAVIE